MGSSAEGAMPAETVAEMPVATAVLGAAMPEGSAPAVPEATVLTGAAEESKKDEMHPETGKDAEKRGQVEEIADESDPEVRRAAKRARQEEIEEEGMTDKEVILKCLRYVQSSLEYTARQAEALKHCQQQLGEIGSAAYHGESCQRYALAAVNSAAGHMKALTWQMTGSRNEEKVSCKSLIQQLLTNSTKTVGLLSKLTENLNKHAEQSAEQSKHFHEVLLAIQGQMADHFARGAASATPITPATGAAPVFPPAAPAMPGYAASVTGGSPVGVGIGGYGGPQAMPATVPAPTAPAPLRSPITLQLRQNDGTIQQRQASPTPYRDESLRNNAGFVFCDDRTYRRLI
eukprot:s1948_g31.t1